MFNTKQFFEDYHIPYRTSGKNVSKGWINISCPFCHDPSYHLGFSTKKPDDFARCWRCGNHWIPKVIALLLSIEIDKSLSIYKEYQTSYNPAELSTRKEIHKSQKTHLGLPFGYEILLPHHRSYLISRNFNPDKLIREWNIMSIGHSGKYPNRILAPIIFEGRMVSYLTRAISSNITPYLPCPKEDEIIPHKHILYGFDKTLSYNQCVVVEGITDVWRLGTGSVALFGKNYKKEQVRLLAKNFKKIFLMFDADVKIEKIDNLEMNLRLFGVDTYTILLQKDDPGKLPQKEANNIMNELGFRR